MAQPKNEYLPLTQMQRAIFVDCSTPDGVDPYVVQVMVDLSEPLDPERFARAVHAVADAHPAVRACFRTRSSGDPVQVVVPAVEVPGGRQDLREVEPGQVRQRLDALRREDAATAFDLARPPLMRYCLVDLPDGGTHLLFSVHHIIVDGWSLPIFFREIMAAYGGATPTAEFAFRDYLALESQADTAAASEAFARVLDGLTAPSMIAEHGVDACGGEQTVTAALTVDQTTLLNDWCRRRELSLASVVETCWAQAVALQTGRTDVVIGVMEANRSLGGPDAAQAVGLFANVVPVRVRLDEDARVAQICERLTQQRLDTLPHRHLGLGRIQAAFRGAQLFDTIVTFQNYRTAQAPAAGAAAAAGGSALHVRATRTHSPTTQPAMLAVVPGEALTVELSVRTEAVSADRAHAMLTSFTHLLASFPEGADRTVRDWPLDSGTAAPRRQVPLSAVRDALAESLAAERPLGASRSSTDTVVKGSAAALEHIARTSPAALLGRRVVVNHPPLTRSAAEAIRAAGAELWLAYAPGGDLACLTPVPHGAVETGVGDPLPGVELRIVDPYGRLVPDESIGEIAVVAGQVCRTGDLGRRRVTGSVEYLGRVDHRIEIRGNRIDPWVIEQLIRAVAGVEEAAVVPLGDGPSALLVAHVSPATADAELVERALLGRLPRYAIPSRVLTWSQLPRTASGEVSLDALADRIDDAAAPSQTVTQLAALFAEVTGAEQVDAHSDFFALGGDSIGVTRLRARAAFRHGWDLDLRQLLELRTPAAIARELVGAFGASGSSNTGTTGFTGSTDLTEPPADRGALVRRPALSGREGALVGMQASLWLLNQLDPESSGYNLTLALDLVGVLDEAALAAAIADVVERHEVLRTRYVAKAGVPVQCVEPLGSHPALLTVVDTPEDLLDGVLAASAGRGFFLGQELPMRAELHRVAPSRATLLLSLHHVAMDGTSFLPLARDLGVAYNARSRGELPRFGLSPVQYLDFAHWSARRLGEPDQPGTLAARQADFWREHLAGLADETGIPSTSGRHDSSNNDSSDGSHSNRAHRLLVEWGPEVRDAVDRLAEQSGSTRFAIYQTAMAAAMHSLGAPLDLALGAPVSVRPHVDLDDAIGNYANFVVCRVQLDPELGLSANCARRARSLAGELDHQDLPFNEVVRAVNAPRRQGRNPLYQTVLALQSFDKPEAELAGLTVSERLMPVADARVDLVVALVEGMSGGGITVSAEYAESAYPAATMSVLVERFGRLLVEAAADPGRPLAQVQQPWATSTVQPSIAAEPVVVLAPTRDSDGGDPDVDAVLAEVVAAYATAIRFREIDPDLGYFDAGGDSIGTVNVAAALARHRVDIATLMTGPSARDLAARIVAGEFGAGTATADAPSLPGEPSAADPSGAERSGIAATGYDVDVSDPFATLLAIRPSGTQRPLFTFHGGVGLSIPYTGLSGVIDPDVPIYGLQSTESIFGVAPAESLTEQAKAYLAQIRTIQPRGPYRLLGWSYGGWAAHETARLIEEDGDEVDLLFIIDSEVPSDDVRSWGPELGQEALIRAFTSVLGIAAADGGDVSTVEQLYAAFQRTEGAFSRLSRTEVRRFVEVMQNHGTLARAHRPGAVTAPTVLYWSSSVGTRHPAELSDDWAPYLAGPVTSLSLEAQHQFLMHPIPQRLIGATVDTLMRVPGRAQLLAEPRYREEFEYFDYLVEPDPVEPDPVEPDPGPAPVQVLAPTSGSRTQPVHRGVAEFLTQTHTLVWRRLHHLRTAPWRLISVALNPLILIVALGYLFADAIVIPGYSGTYMSYLLAGVAAQAGLQNIGPTAVAIRDDLDKGLFDRFRSLPMGRGVVLLAHSLADSLIGVVGLLIVMLGGYLAGWRLGTDLAGLVTGVLVLVLFTYTCVWLGIGVGLLVKSLESIQSIGVTLSVGLSFLSNALLAPQTLPKWIEPFAEWNPVSAVASAVRQAWGNPTAQSASFAGDHPLLVMTVFCAVVLLVVPVLSQRRYAQSR